MRVKPFADLYEEQLELTEILGARPAGVVTGIPSGISPVDELLGGFQTGNLIVVVGSNGIGKSGLALQIALHAARRTSVLLCSLQLSGPEQVARCVQQLETGAFQAPGDARRGHDFASPGSENPGSVIDEARTTAGNVSLRRVLASVTEFELAILDVPRLRMEQLSNCCTAVAKRDNLGMIIVDQIELLRTGGEGDDRIDELDELARALKRMARDLDCPVLTTARYEREPEVEPSLSRLREQNTITYHADVAMTLDRFGDTKANEVDLTIVKNRNGTLGHTALRWTRDGLQP